MARPKQGTKTLRPAQTLKIPEGCSFEGDYSFRSPEDSAEKLHRRRREDREFWIKDVSLYIAALFIMLATAIYCIWTLFQPALPREERQWVMSTLHAMMVGIIGYVFGKATK